MKDPNIENEIQAKSLTAPRVTMSAIEDAIERIDIVTHTSMSGQVLRWAVLNMHNGFAITGKPSCAVSPQNDDAELGKKIATDNAISEAWVLLGYVLKQQLHDIANAQPPVPTSFQDRVRAEAIELDEKLKKLVAFFPTDTFAALPADEQERLHAQAAAMTDYSAVLSERIAAFAD